jgi:hypothetical protein
MKNNKIALAVAFIAVFLFGLGSGYLLWHRSLPAGGFRGPPGSSVAVSGSSNAIGTLFSSYSLAQYSYLISGNATLSPSGKVATEDFNLTSTALANGSVSYSMKFAETGVTYSVTVGNGDKLYWIDTNLADDSPKADVFTGDDGYAVVNSTGYIIALKYPLPYT